MLQVTFQRLSTVSLLIVALTSSAGLSGQVSTDWRDAARSSFASGDVAGADRQLQQQLETFRAQHKDLEDKTARRQWFHQLVNISYEYLRGQQIERATDLLGKAADLGLGPEYNIDHGLAPTLGAWHRQLALMDAEQRFDLLSQWTLPNDDRPGMRMLHSLVPHAAPPRGFARAVGERPRPNSFAVAAIGDVRGLFSSAWVLVDAAEESGRLRRLMTQLEELVDNNVQGARWLQMLAEIRRLRGRPNAELSNAIAEQTLAPPSDGSRIDYRLLVVAAACANHASLAEHAETHLEPLITATFGGESYRMRPFLRTVQAVAIRNRWAGSESTLLADPNLALWQPSMATTAERSAMGCVPSLWLTHEDHVIHLAGPRNSVLWFRYPLTGEFTFSCETQVGGQQGTEGGVEFGGLGFEDWPGGRVFKARDADLVNIEHRASKYVRQHPHARYFRLAIKSRQDGYTVFSNGHPMWQTGSAEASPWLGLRAFRDRRPTFRNLRIEGDPVIPRQVQLTAGSELRGWRAGYYGQKLPSPFTDDDTTAQAGWFLRDGEISAGPSKSASSSGDVRPAADGLAPSRLTYARPLQDAESVSYQFWYEAGKPTVHPTLGRLAFLIESSGVRLRWMTDGDREWTGLATDNAIVEPLNRRGPRPLPLKANDWNDVAVELRRDTLSLTLNEQLIYQRKIEGEIARTLGFYRDQPTAVVRVRRVNLQGEWPERLTEAQKSNPLALADTGRTSNENRALNAIIGEETIASNGMEVLRQSAQLAQRARYERLHEWVFPGDDHPNFRLTGDFTPANPVPSNSGDASKTGSPALAGRTRVRTGGKLVSPAIALVETAREINRLDELRAEITALTAATPYAARSHAALLCLIDIAADDKSRATQSLGELFDLFRAAPDAAQRWPETLVAERAVRYPATRKLAGEMLYIMYELHRNGAEGWQEGRQPAWENHFYFVMGLHTHLENLDPLDQFTTDPKLQSWVPVALDSARTRGDGHSPSHWRAMPGQIDSLAGHDDDYLFFRSPLRGDYEVECDLTPFSYRNIHVVINGGWVEAHWQLNKFRISSRREPYAPWNDLEPPLGRIRDWAHFRAIVRDGICTSYFNGRKVLEQPITAASDPWLALRSWNRYRGAVRNLRITGTPEIPEQIALTASPQLTGWEHWQADTSLHNAWRFDEAAPQGGLIGVPHPSLRGTYCESLLRYYRPMLEDGAIDYEFYYQPGKSIAHPALDRLAFLLSPAGVDIHWVTDGMYDRSGASPANRTSEPRHRRGNGPLPLRASQWNRARLSLKGDVVSLELNGQLVYQRPLEADNQRTFGIFHYADQTTAQVRNVVWRGNWPRQIPGLTEQQLAGNEPSCLIGIDELAEETRFEFLNMMRSDSPFRTWGYNWQNSIRGQPDGVRVMPTSRDTWTAIRYTYDRPIYGDFDAQLRFEDLKMEYGERGTVGLEFNAIDDSGVIISCTRTATKSNRAEAVAKISVPVSDGKRRYFTKGISDEADHGILRLIRRGNELHALIAHGDSGNFRYIGSQSLPGTGTGMVLQPQVTSTGSSKVEVVLSDLTIRSNTLAIEKRLDRRALAVSQYTRALPEGFRHVFSPAGDPGEFLLSDGINDQVTDKGLMLRIDREHQRRELEAVGRRGLEGDFDISAQLTADELPREQTGDVSLSVGISGPGRDRAVLAIAATSEQKIAVTARLESPDNVVAQVEVDSLDGLRIARIQGTILFLISSDGYYRLLGTADIATGPIQPQSIRFTARGGDRGQSSVAVQLGGLEVRAGKLVEP